MAFLFNLALFLFVFLPGVAAVSMVLANLAGGVFASSPDWEVGWSPVLWLILTAPWLLPVAVVVPVLHVLAGRTARMKSPAAARRVALGAAPVLFTAAVLVLWGPGNFRLEFILPVAVSGLLYGAILRIPLPRE